MRKNPILYFIICILILIFIGVLSVVNTLSLLKLENKIARNHRLSQVLEETQTNMQKTHIATRNFIITGNPAEIKKSKRAQQLYYKAQHILENEIADPQSQAFLEVLSHLRQNRINEYRVDYINMREQNGVNYTLDYFATHADHKTYTDEIPKLIDTIKKRQATILKATQDETQVEINIVLLIIIIGSILSIVIASVAIYIIYKDMVTRKNNELQLVDFTKKLKKRNTQLFDFSSIISHNLRAPLVNIYMLTDYIEEAESEMERKDSISKLKKVTHNINEVFNELVDTLQIMEDIEIVSEKIDLEKTLKNTLIEQDILINKEDAKIEIDFSQAPEITYPKKYIESILSNLLSNAIKFKQPNTKPTIFFKTQKTGKNIELLIIDNGLGIDTELHKERLFKIRQVFHNHLDSKGLGLFMTKTQLTAMGDEIKVESAINKGSTFIITFKNQNK